MTADQLCRLAVLIERTDYDAIDRAAAYLRACANALDAGPVAWIKTARGGARRLDWNEQTHYADADYPVAVEPLYPIAMPGALRLPEPMTDAEILSANYWPSSAFQIARAIEAETLRRVKEANE